MTKNEFCDYLKVAKCGDSFLFNGLSLTLDDTFYFEYENEYQVCPYLGITDGYSISEILEHKIYLELKTQDKVKDEQYE